MTGSDPAYFPERTRYTNAPHGASVKERPDAGHRQNQQDDVGYSWADRPAQYRWDAMDAKRMTANFSRMTL
jgi:hypothetical protein